MEKNPFEQEKLNKINKVKDEIKTSFGLVFNDKENFNKKINELIINLEHYHKNGLLFDLEGTIGDIKKGVEIKDQEAFIPFIMKTLEPFITATMNQPKFFEKAKRETENSAPNRIKLSELLSFELNQKDVYIHLGAAREFIKEEGISLFKKDIEDGLYKLAEVVKSNNNIDKVRADSWIIAKNPTLIENLGFTVEDGITTEEGDNRPFAKAFMNREEFLNKYGNKEE